MVVFSAIVDCAAHQDGAQLHPQVYQCDRFVHGTRRGVSPATEARIREFVLFFMSSTRIKYIYTYVNILLKISAYDTYPTKHNLAHLVMLPRGVTHASFYPQVLFTPN